MKTAISLPDELFKAADRYAKEHRISRSELYSRALKDYLKLRTGVTEALNELYKDEPSEVDPVLMRLQWDAIKKDPWE
jgi:metal-responsive CopG/Arc/MetJ family transcriptional regulator